MLRLPALCLAFVLRVVAVADAQLTPSQTARIDSLATAALRSGPIAGMTIAVASGSGDPWVRAYGIADREHNVAAQAGTVYRVRSISKTFAAAAVLQLAAQGKVGLDSDVTRYLPDAPTRGAHITVRQLLSHTSGLPNYHGATWRAHYHERLSAAQWVHLPDSEPLLFAPGSDYAYSNMGFDLLALLVERVSGEAFPQFLNRRIIGPLGLRNTTHCTEEEPPPGRAAPYDVRNGQLAPADAWADVEYGAAMICSTASDLIAWARALDAGRVLDKRWLTEMRSPTPLVDGVSIDYGLGTRLGALDGHAMFGHTGSGGGWSSALADFPSDHLVVTVLTNTEPAAAPDILASIARAVLGVVKPSALTMPPNVIAAVTSRWVSGSDTVRVVPMGDGLGAGPLPNGPPQPVPLEFLGGNRFRVAPAPMLEFQFLPRNSDSGTQVATHLFVYTAGFFQAIARRIP